jgi:secreted trypsin-like serine protease
MKFLSVAPLLVSAAEASSIPHPKVIGGQSITISEAPFMAAILNCHNPSSFASCWEMCSGSLIAPNVILTAAHCVRDGFVGWNDLSTNVNPGNLKVLLGSSNWMDLDSTARTVGVSSIAFSSFGSNIRFPMDGDIALLELAECVPEISGVIEYAKVSTWDSEPDRSTGCTNVSVAGFGAASNAPFPLSQDDGKLRMVVDNLHTAEVCRQSYTALEQGWDVPDLTDSTDVTAAVLGENYICTGGVSWHSVCYGDSGGPTFKKMDNEKFQVLGVTSFGFGRNYCTIGPDFATRVAFFADWILEVMTVELGSCSNFTPSSAFAVNPPTAYPESSLSAMWNASRCNPNADRGGSEWQCLNGACIDSTRVCDRSNTCTDSSDETYVDSRTGVRLCPLGTGRRLDGITHPPRKGKMFLKTIGGESAAGSSIYTKNVKGSMSCTSAAVGVNSAIEATSTQPTIGDLYWDPTAVINACDAFVNCVSDGSYNDSEQIFCEDLDNYLTMQAEANRWEDSFGSRFSASCPNDDLIETLTDAPPANRTTYSPNSRGYAAMGLSAVVAAMAVIAM